MLRNVRNIFSLFLAAGLVVSSVPVNATAKTMDVATTKAPLKFSMTYSDNATLPFKETWFSVQEAEKKLNVDIQWEIIPSTDYQQKISLGLNSGTAADVVLYQSVRSGEMAALALNGAIVPISDYSNLTPNFNKMVKDFNMQADVDGEKLKDGKRYYMPRLTDKPFYDGGLILREDFLTANKLNAPKTFDDLYNIMTKYKEQNPKSYALTNLVDQRVTYRMMMPSFGISLGRNASSGTYVLSYDYGKKEFFAGAIDGRYKEYLKYMAKLFKGGLYDPEVANAGDKWTTKLATGASMASYAYYDQIGGLESTSTIKGIKFNMYPPLVGPGGAHHQPKNRVGAGPVFPIATKKKANFNEIVQAVDKMFYSPELSAMWCLGVEGTTYTKSGDKITYNKDITSSKDGVYKAMQLLYGLGADPLQHVWVNEREMTKYDENYANINKTVAAMDSAIQPLPPFAKLNDVQAEETGFLQAPLSDAWENWANAFITGQKDLDKDWDAYVTEMKSKGIEKFLKLYNDNK